MLLNLETFLAGIIAAIQICEMELQPHFLN